MNEIERLKILRPFSVPYVSSASGYTSHLQSKKDFIQNKCVRKKSSKNY
jgi:hypothetical protein